MLFSVYKTQIAEKLSMTTSVLCTSVFSHVRSINAITFGIICSQIHKHSAFSQPVGIRRAACICQSVISLTYFLWWKAPCTDVSLSFLGNACRLSTKQAAQASKLALPESGLGC